MKAWVALALLLASAPAVAGQAAPSEEPVSAPVGATPTTLYFHLIDFQDFPVNTQVPQFLFTSAPTIGLATNTLSCLPQTPGNNLAGDWHTWHGYSTPTYVEYDRVEDGHPRVNAIRGLSWDVPVSGPATLQWYLAVRSNPGGTEPAVPVPLANVVVSAEIRAPDSLSVDDAAYDSGPILAAGRSSPALLAGDATQGAEHSVADGVHVYGFSVPLKFEAAEIPQATGYTLKVQAFIDSPACPSEGGGVMPSQATPHIDAAHLPRLELAAGDALRVSSLVPVVGNGTPHIEAAFNSAWGSYDVDEGNVTLTVEGPDGPVPTALADFVQRTHEWAHFTEPVRATWALPDDLPDGLYRANLTVVNDQHTATAVAHAAFSLGPDRSFPAPPGGGLPDTSGASQAMPGASPGFLGLLLAAAVGLIRLRGNR